MPWDAIIIGAGSAGCAAAYQLVRAGKRVLVLEAGGSDRSLHIKIPAAVWRIQPQHDWGYTSRPDPTRQGAREQWHRGKVLGGTSSINGMVYARGASADYDRWSQVCGGAGGWSGKDLVPIFRELEHSDQHNAHRGNSGPLYVRTVRRPHAVSRAFIEAGQVAGYPFNPDYNGGDQEGLGYLQFTQRRGLRWSAADAFLKPLLHRQNLMLLLRATVERIEIEQGRAVAVVFQHQGKPRRETANDIILSAGAVNTPQLLMLSGVGDPDELQKLGITPKVAIPTVGRHLKDHPLVHLDFRCRIPTYNLTEGLAQKLAIAGKYLRHREGPIAAAYEAAAFLKTRPDATIPEIQVFFAPVGWGAENGQAKLAPYPAIKIVILRSHAASSGRVLLASRDPLAPPVIESRLLEDPSDVACLVRGIEIVRKIMAARPIANLIHSEVTPGPGIDTAQRLADFVYQHAEPSCHAMGSCRMGAGEDTVVGPDLRVRGLRNLWIADASVVPDAISANLNAVSILIGAKLGKQLTALRA